MTIVFRASGIGHPCPRKLWYEAVKGLEEPHNLQTLFTFDIGTAIESVAIKYLRHEGWEVLYNEGSQEAEIETIIHVAPGIEIRGHHDMVLRRGEGSPWIMGDVKTMKSFAYKDWKKHGTMAKYPQYFDQTTIYTAGEYAQSLGIETMGIWAINKDKVEYPVPYDTERFSKDRLEDLKLKAFYIAMSEVPPVPDDAMPTWCCSYCGFRRDRTCDHTF